MANVDNVSAVTVPSYLRWTFLKKWFGLCCILAFPLLYIGPVLHAQENVPNPPPTESISRVGEVNYLSSTEFWLSVMILIFGLVVVIIQYFLLKQVIREKTDQVVQVFTVLLIIIGTLLLISSGFSSEQIAPALGLFGTIAGYLLGKNNPREASSKDTAEPVAPEERKV